MERNLTTGSIWKNIFYFSLPYLLSYFLQTLYGMADLFIIGQFEGAAGTTAVSIGSQVMHMITVIIVGLAMGTTVSIAQAVGAKDKKQASRCTGNTITLFLGVSVVLMVILLLLVKPIVLVMSTPFEAVSGTVAYLTICFIGIPFIIAYNIISSIFRGLGDSKSPMYFIAVACAANIALDYLFMGTLHLGPSGAALGTTLSQTLSVILALIAIRKRDTGIRLTRSDLSPQTAVMGQILKIGVPIALQDGFIQIAFIIITIIANRLRSGSSGGSRYCRENHQLPVPDSIFHAFHCFGARRAEHRCWKAEACRTDHVVCCTDCCRFRTDRRYYDSVYFRSCGRSFHNRCGGCTPRRSVYPRLYLGLHFCWSPLHLQRLFLCLRTVGIFLPAQYHCHSAC